MVNIMKIADIKPHISREIILDKLSPIEIFRNYIPDNFVINKPFSSPLRVDDTPSFSIYESKDTILYNDFVLGGGDCLRFVKELFGFSSWYDTYSRIAIDFQLDKDYAVRKLNGYFKRDYRGTINKAIKRKEKAVELSVSTRKWENYDYTYWKKYGINQLMLQKYEVYPISRIFMKYSSDTLVVKADKHAYCFIERKDGKVTMKIYQPFSKYKWMTSHDHSVWQGWKQLPQRGENLIITKSLKDVMAINQNSWYAAVALQQEGANPKYTVIDELKKRFKKIFVLYDNDFDKVTNWGKLAAKKLCRDYNLYFIMIPSSYEAKDFTDLIKKHGIDVARKLLETLINERLQKESDKLIF